MVKWNNQPIGNLQQVRVTKVFITVLLNLCSDKCELLEFTLDPLADKKNVIATHLNNIVYVRSLFFYTEGKRKRC